jgi:hypothetical protein
MFGGLSMARPARRLSGGSRRYSEPSPMGSPWVENARP